MRASHADYLGVEQFYELFYLFVRVAVRVNRDEDGFKVEEFRLVGFFEAGDCLAEFR